MVLVCKITPERIDFRFCTEQYFHVFRTKFEYGHFSQTPISTSPTQKYQIPQNIKAVIKNIYFRCSIEMLHQIGNYIELFPISYQITILYQFELFQYYSIIGNKSVKTITKILNKKFKHIILIYILFQINLYL